MPAIIILSIVTLVSLGIIIWLLWRRSEMENQLDAAIKTNSTFEIGAVELKKSLEEAISNYERERKAYQILKDEIEILEADLAKCSGPGDVKRRIERLLSATRTGLSSENSDSDKKLSTGSANSNSPGL